MDTGETPRQGADGQEAGSKGHERRGIGVDLVVLDRFFASGLAVTLDVLATANTVSTAQGEAGFFHWRILSPDGNPAHSSAGAEVGVDGAVGGVPGQVVCVFGPGMADASRIASDLDRDDTRTLVPWLETACRAGATLAASCSSTFLLAETGLLDGGEATTSWWLTDAFRDRYPRVRLRPDAMVCVHERLHTAGAAMAQLDLTLHLLRHLGGHGLADVCARYLVIDQHRTSQVPYLIPEHVSRRDAVVAQAEDWLRSRLDEPFEVSALARACGVSARTLSRRFRSATRTSPAEYVRRLRLETAARLLTDGDDPVSRVAEAVGYTDERAFRRAFSACFGASPAAYRSYRRV